MTMVRNALLILFALIIDILQATLSAGLFMIGAFPGTAAGAAGGCIIGTYVNSTVGCAFVGVVAGAAGSILNTFSVGTLPYAVGLGFIVNFCLDISLGTLLVMFLMSQKMYYPRYGIGGFVAELIPGLNDLPAWTAMVILSIIRKQAEQKKLKGNAGSTFAAMMGGGVVGFVAPLISNIKQDNMQTVREVGTYTEQQQREENSLQHERIIGSELKTIDGIRPRQATPGSSVPESPRYAT